MMDYEVFKEVVKENLLDYMPEKYQDSEMRVDSVEKINRKMDGLSPFGGWGQYFTNHIHQ